MRKGLAAAGVVALITTGAAACGSEEPSTPRGKVDNAFTKLGEQKSVALGLSFAATPAQIYAAMGGADDFTRADADIVAGLHATASFSADKPLAEVRGDDKTTSYGIELAGGASGKSAGRNLVGLRSVDQKFYIRLDLKGIAALDPGGDSGLGGINDLLGSADNMPSSFGSVKALVKGGWVSIDPKAFAEFANTLGGGSSDSDDSAGPDDTGSGDTGSGDGSPLHSPLGGFGLPSSLPTALPAGLGHQTLAELLAPLGATLAKDGKVTDLGSRDGADHLKVTAPARAFAKDLQAGYGSLFKELPGDLQDSLDDVPNKTVALDIALKDGKLSGISFDLAQLDDTVHGKLPVDLSVDGGAEPVSAPEGAQQLDPQDLMGLVMSKLGDLGAKPGKLPSFTQGSAIPGVTMHLSGL